jgi:V/A-type H+/Na+-transporting ATPase subunit E
MDDKLKALTEIIVKEGVDKAAAQGQEIVARARQEAGEIVRQAQKEAADTLAQVQRRAVEVRKNAEAEMKLAGQQMVSALKQRIADLVLNNALEKPIAASFSRTDFLGQIIVELARNWKPINAERLDMRVLLPEDKYREVEQFLQQRAKEILAAGLKVEADKQVRSGFQITPADHSFKLSFSEAEFMTFFKTSLRAKTNALLFGDK